MNGKFLLDTNAVVALLGGNASLALILQDASWIGISVITELEVLSFSNLTAQDEALFLQFKSRVQIVDLQTSRHTLLSKDDRDTQIRCFKITRCHHRSLCH